MPGERSKGVVLHLGQQLGRLPEPEEVSAVYESRNLGTGEAARDREKRHARAIQSAAKSFDPAKAKGYRYVVGQYLPLLQRLISEQDLKAAALAANYPRNLTHEDLDAGLGFQITQTLKVQRDTDLSFTAPVDAMLAWFRALKAEGKIRHSCNYSKVGAIRVALRRADLITLLDDDYKPAFLAGKGKGIAKKWGLGENCPQYSQFASIWAVSSQRNQKSSSNPLPEAPQLALERHSIDCVNLDPLTDGFQIKQSQKQPWSKGTTMGSG